MSPSVRRIKNLLSSSSTSKKKTTKKDKSSKSGEGERRPESEERQALSFTDWDSTADLGRLPWGQATTGDQLRDLSLWPVARRGVELGSDIEEMPEDDDEYEEAVEEDENEAVPVTPTFNISESERVAERRRMIAKAFGGLPSSSSMQKSRSRYRSGSGYSAGGQSSGASTVSLPRPGTSGSLSRTVTPGSLQRPATPGSPQRPTTSSSIPRSATPGAPGSRYGAATGMYPSQLSLARGVQETSSTNVTPQAPKEGSQNSFPQHPTDIEENMMSTSGVRKGHMRSGRKPARLKLSEKQPSSSGKRSSTAYSPPYGQSAPGRITPGPTSSPYAIAPAETAEELRKRRLKGIVPNNDSEGEETTWSAVEDPFPLSSFDPNKKRLPDGTEGSSISRPSYQDYEPPSEKDLECYETLRATFAHSIALQRTAVPLLGIACDENIPSELRGLLSRDEREGLYTALNTAQNIQERLRRMALYNVFDTRGNNIEIRAKNDVNRTGGDPDQIAERVRDWMTVDEKERVQQIDLNRIREDSR